jgi:hypothetical protein
MAEFDLALAANKLLALMVEQLTLQDIIMPERVYIAPGSEIPYDCEQFTLHLDRVGSNIVGKDTGSPVPRATLMNYATLISTMVRCIPVQGEGGDLPSPASMSAASGVLLRDARGIRRSYERIVQNNLFVPRNVPCVIGDVTAVGPSGGLAGVTGTLAFQTVDVDWHWDQPDQEPLWELVSTP